MKKTSIAVSCVFAYSAATGFAQTTSGSPADLGGLMKNVLTALEARDQIALEKLAITDASDQDRTIYLTGTIVEHDGSYEVATFSAPAPPQATPQPPSR